MTNQERYRSLASQLGLSGGWLEVSRKALVDRTVRMPSGCYFLCWGDRPQGIIWLEGERAIDKRLPTPVAWIFGCLFSDHRPVREVAKLIATDKYPHPPQGMYPAFRACQEFPHREALLRTVGFHQWEGPFGLMECIATPVTWEWK